MHEHYSLLEKIPLKAPNIDILTIEYEYVLAVPHICFIHINIYDSTFNLIH